MRIKPTILLVAGLAGASGLPATYAQSSVTIYGTIDANLGSRQLSGGVRNTVINDAGMSNSHFGFRGTEDLGGGLKANFDFSGFFGPDTGASGRFAGDTLFSRRAAVGLSGSLGRIDLGRGASPYFFSLIFFNPFGASSTYSPIFLHTYTGAQFPINTPPLNAPDNTIANMIQYTTPLLNGLRASVLYAPGEVAGDSGKKLVSSNVTYMKGSLALTLAMERNSSVLGPLGAQPNPEQRQLSYLTGVSYDFGVVKLFGQYQQTKQEFRSPGTDRTIKTGQLGATAPAGMLGTLLLSWARSRIDLPAGVSAYTVVPGFPALPAGTPASGVNPTRDTVTLGYDYNLSKRTDVYALLMVDKYTGLDTGKSMALGLRHHF